MVTYSPLCTWQAKEIGVAQGLPESAVVREKDPMAVLGILELLQHSILQAL